MEILKGATATLRYPPYGADPVVWEEEAEVSVKILRDSDGAEIKLEEPKAEFVEGKGADIDHYVFTLEAQPEVDLLTVIWEDEANSYMQKVEVVGAYVCSVASIVDKLGEEPDDAEVEAKREIATREVESSCGRAFRPRYARDQLNGKGTAKLVLNNRNLIRLIRVTIDSEAMSEEGLEGLTLDPSGKLKSPSFWPVGESNIEVAYVYGFENFPQAELPIRDYAAHLLTKFATDWEGRASSKTDEFGATYSFITPGVRGARFPIPSVNAFVQEFSAPLVG